MASKQEVADENARQHEALRHCPVFEGMQDLSHHPGKTPDESFPPLDFVPRTSFDSVLTSFAQLGALRLGVTRCFISLLDGGCQIILAEATQSSSVGLDTRNTTADGLRLGCVTLRRDQGLDESVLSLPPSSKDPLDAVVIINETHQKFGLLQRLNARFYAAVPLRGADGHVIGSYNVVDENPHQELDSAQAQFLHDIGDTVVSYLKTLKAQESKTLSEHMVHGLTSFVTGAGEMRDMPVEDPIVTPLSHVTTVAPPRNLRSDHQEKDQKTDPVSQDSLQEGILPPHSKYMFSRAANIMRVTSELEGVIFFDASIANSAHLADEHSDESTGHSSASESPSGRDHTVSDQTTPSSTSVDPNMCHILAFAHDQRSSRAGDIPQKYLALEEKNLEELLRRYPEGNIFRVAELNRYSSSDDSTRPPRPKKTKKKRSSEKRVIRAILKLAPNARQVAFIPLWDFHRERWFAGCLCWTSALNRILSSGNDLIYLRAFGNSIMTELSRIDAEEADKAKSTFIASISHELRSPLHGILGAQEVLRETGLDATQLQMVDSIDTCGRTLLDTINHVLDYSKINKFFQQPSHPRIHNIKSAQESDIKRARPIADSEPMEAIDIARLTEETLEATFSGQSLRSLSSKHDRSSDPSMLIGTDSLHPSDQSIPTRRPIQIVLDIPRSTAQLVRVNPGAWRRVIMNLFGNAIKYTASGSIRVSLSTTHENRSQHVKLTVADSGKGISPNYLRNRLYTPFSQENQFAAGSGLGLSIVRQVIQDLKGEIDLKSDVGVGTVVTVDLALPSESHGSPTMDDYVLSVAERMKGKRMRIIENVPAVSHDRQPDSNHGTQIGPSLALLLQDWFGLESIIATTWEYTNQEPIVCVDSSLHFLSSAVARNHPCIMVALDLVEASTLRQDVRVIEAGIQVLTQPCGPLKLAKALEKLFDRFEESGRINPAAPPQTGKSDRRLDASPSTTDRTSGASSPAHQSPQIPDPSFESVGTSVTTPPPGSQKPDIITVDQNPTGSELTGETSHPPSTTGAPSLLSPPGGKHDAASRTFRDVLVVDDNALNVRLLITFLEKNNISYSEAHNGREAVEAFKQDPTRWNTILMDLSMPVMDGITATRKIREVERGNTASQSNRSTSDESSLSQKDKALSSPTDTELTLQPKAEMSRRKVRIIALTGLASATARFEALSAGVDVFMTKPVQFKSLMDILKDGNNKQQSKTEG